MNVEFPSSPGMQNNSSMITNICIAISEIENLDGDTKSAKIKELLLHLICVLVRNTVLVIEDCHQIDQARYISRNNNSLLCLIRIFSWNLIKLWISEPKDVVNGICSLLLTTRPTIFPDYQKELSECDLIITTLNPLQSRFILGIAVPYFQQIESSSVLSSEIGEMIVSKAQGNPLFAASLSMSLIESNLVHFDQSLNEWKFVNATATIRIPTTIEKVDNFLCFHDH